MKRTYSTPSAEKLAFKYRDQVVAASGDPTLNQPGGGSTLGDGQFSLSDLYWAAMAVLGYC